MENSSHFPLRYLIENGQYWDGLGKCLLARPKERASWTKYEPLNGTTCFLLPTSPLIGELQLSRLERTLGRAIRDLKVGQLRKFTL